ncbi:MAG: hypothetical protein DMG85_08350 [Acidobacteria bacterium]|nr:MAG: hypothetical protein DMG85_08350 [Acidobacteriota bacterium]
MLSQNPSVPVSVAGSPGIRVTHVLGLEGVSGNTTGNLTIEDNTLQFQKSGGATNQVSIASIQAVFLGEQSKQVGGLPMTLGKAATPFGGGRVISLFSHKKYDTLTVEYLDVNGGLHGAIFQLNKGQGEVIKNELVAKGVHVTEVEVQPKKQSTSEVESESK